jgi:hypothetical protein
LQKKSFLAKNQQNFRKYFFWEQIIKKISTATDSSYFAFSMVSTIAVCFSVFLPFGASGRNQPQKYTFPTVSTAGLCGE